MAKTVESLTMEGREAFKCGDLKTAIESYEQVIALERRPEACSVLGYCLAKEKGAYKEALALGSEAIKKEPKEMRHFLLLGKVYVMAGRKKEAYRAFSLGLRLGPSLQLESELRQLGMRRPPVLSFLKRGNPFNKLLGKIFGKMGLR